MSSKIFGSLNSQISFFQRMPSRSYTFAQTLQLIRRESMAPEEKHTFFPGNEILRNRLHHSSTYIFLSDSTFKLIWDFIIFICTIYLSIIIPFALSFFSDPPYETYYTISVVYLFDILISLNSSYYERGKAVSNRQKIVKKYLMTWFLLDFVSVLPFEALQRFEENQEIRVFEFETDYIRLLMLMKLVKILKVRKFLQKLLDLSTNSSFFSGFKILIFLVLLFIAVHWMSCIFNIFYCLSLQSEYVYWKNVRVNLKDRYLKIYLRVFQTMTSVGYGDFVVKTTAERILILFFMVFTSGFFGYFIGQVEETIMKSSKIDNYFRRIKQRLLIFFEVNNLPKSVRSKINSYIRYLTYTYRNNLLQDQDIVQFLSIPLSEQIFLFTKGHMLISVEFFSGMSRQCIRAFGYKLEFRVYGPNDLIFAEGQMTDDFFCITSGTIQIFHEASKTVFADLHQDDIFGEISFILKQKRSSSARARNFSELFSLSRFDCDKVLQKLPKDAENFLTIVRNVKIYGLSIINISCYLCRKLGHLAKNCEDFIWKPKIDVNHYYSRKKIVNTILSPKRKKRKISLNDRYGIKNTFGFRDKEFFGENQYLARKTKEYRDMSHKYETQFCRVSKLIENECEEDSDSEESEGKYEKVKIMYNLQKKYSVIPEW